MSNNFYEGWPKWAITLFSILILVPTVCSGLFLQSTYEGIKYGACYFYTSLNTELPKIFKVIGDNSKDA